MPRPEDSVWAVSVAQVASRPGQSKPIDTVFPAPAGIGDSVVGVREGADIRVVGSFDSIVDGLVFTGRRMHTVPQPDRPRLDRARHRVRPVRFRCMP